MRFSFRHTPTANENLGKMRELFKKLKPDVPLSNRKLYRQFHNDMRLIERIIKLDEKVASLENYGSAMYDEASALVKSAAQFAAQKYGKHYYTLKTQTETRYMLDILWLLPAAVGVMNFPLALPAPFDFLIVGTLLAGWGIPFSISAKIDATRKARLEKIGNVSYNYQHNPDAVAEQLAYTY